MTDGISSQGLMNVQERFPVASFTVGSEWVDFPIEDDSLSGGNRIVEHARPYRDGAKLDDTGSQPRRWTLNAIFNNTIREPGIPEDPALYPDVMNKVIEFFNRHETGDLSVPVDGKVRARAHSYQRSHSRDEVDTGRLVLTFIEDNEDNVDAASFSRPSVYGSAVRLAEITHFTAEQEGVWSGDLQDLLEFCAELEGLMRAPGEYTAAVALQVRSAHRAMRSVLQTAQTVAQGNDESQQQTNAILATYGVPVNTILQLQRMLDVTAYATSEKNGQMPRPIPYVVRQPTTIYGIAADVRQPVAALLEINEQRIEDPFAIEPGTYRVFERWP